MLSSPDEPAVEAGPEVTMNAQDTENRQGGSLARRLGWKRLSITLLALAIILPVAMITLGVVAVPILAVPAAIIFLAGVIVYAIGRTKHVPLPDEEDGR